MSDKGMTEPGRDADLDLVIERVIRAPRAAVWRAWTDPRQLEQWWIPAPAVCRVDALELRAGGAFRTSMSEDGAAYGPQIDGCILAVEPEERLVFTTALLAGWRPSPTPFITAVMTFETHPEGTLYRAVAMHKDPGDRAMHEEVGFFEGWGTVTRQLAELVEGGAPAR